MNQLNKPSSKLAVCVNREAIIERSDHTKTTLGESVAFAYTVVASLREQTSDRITLALLILRHSFSLDRHTLRVLYWS